MDGLQFGGIGGDFQQAAELLIGGGEEGGAAVVGVVVLDAARRHDHHRRVDDVRPVGQPVELLLELHCAVARQRVEALRLVFGGLVAVDLHHVVLVHIVLVAVDEIVNGLDEVGVVGGVEALLELAEIGHLEGRFGGDKIDDGGAFVHFVGAPVEHPWVIAFVLAFGGGVAAEGAVGEEAPVGQMEPEGGLGGGFGTVAHGQFGGDLVGLFGNELRDHHEVRQQEHDGRQDAHDHHERQAGFAMWMEGRPLHRLSSLKGSHLP